MVRQDEGLVVWLVHGTWARHAKWTHANSPLCEVLRDKIDAEVEFRRVSWRGRNQDRDRMRAALALVEESKSPDLASKRQVAIAHSHGGNAALRAVSHPESRLDGLVTMNTPFMAVLPRDRWLLILHAVLLMLGGYIFYDNTVRLGIFWEYLVLFGAGAILAVLVVGAWLTRTDAEPEISPAFDLPSPKEAGRKRRNVLCVASADDEATGWLEFFDVAANAPYLLLHRLAIPLALAGIVAVHVTLSVPLAPATTDTVGVALTKITASGGQFEWSWTEELRGVLLEDTPRLSREDRRWVGETIDAEGGVIEALAVAFSSLEYWVTLWFLLAAAALGSAYVIRAAAFGLGWGSRAVAGAFLSRLKVTHVPVSTAGAELIVVGRSSKGPGSALRHSAIYGNRVALEQVAAWINAAIMGAGGGAEMRMDD